MTEAAEAKSGARISSEGGDGTGTGEEISLKDKGNDFFKSGNYLKAAALYTQAIKLDPSNPALYSNRAAAFLQLVKLNKALADAETTISLKPQWEKGYFRKGCILEAMEQYDDALTAFQTALQYNPQSSEVSRKIKRVSQLARDKKRAQEVENKRLNFDMGKNLDTLKLEMSEKYGSEECWKDIFSFLVETMETAVKSWHESSKVDPRVHFLLDREKTQTDKYAPNVNIDKAFESPHTHGNCSSFLRQYAEESFSRAACLVTPKSIISYPQVWKGQGSRKWKHGQHDGFFVQFESPSLRKLWFIPSSNEMGQTLCRDPEVLDISAHEVLPRLFKETLSNS
ncbi:uncharacterized protein LOC132179798 [Corylus avellana]|uniref:uncharacterized protein LOC132179798 n=1 Tax=Corylus avellana TaxID=13451 RepID=UPI00286AEB06|nr:uncharacterized protein LOC132179798 [Corylus avellana]